MILIGLILTGIEVAEAEILFWEVEEMIMLENKVI
jgi:hypothetical protein